MSDAFSPSTGGLVSEELLERFLVRIAEDLAARPLGLSADEHRGEIARQLERAGGATHYELLGRDGGAPAAEVAGSFTALARLVHPLHAASLRLPEPVLRLLFEKATRAYLVLSDPDRRREYDLLYRPRGPSAPLPRSPEEIAAARREMARSSFKRAQVAMRAEHYHTVIELMRDAVRWDPRPEAFALLAEALAKNPHWLESAANQFREAVELAPREPAYRLRLAQLLESLEHREEAATEYHKVLERMPGHPEALAGLARLADGPVRR
jgi:tetratricopeptide (TPR) repeat protein